MARFYNRLITQTVPAGGVLPLPGPGSLIVIKEASAPFDLEIDDDGKSTYEGGFTIDTGSDRFQKLTVYNRSQTEALTFNFYVGRGSGKAGVSFDYLRERSTKLRTTTVSDASPATVQFPGVALNSAAYSGFGVATGARRRQFVVLVPAASAGTVTVRESISDGIIQTFAAGVADGFTLATDHGFSVQVSAGAIAYVTELFNS